tara:strand:+ start:1395 stop:2276 length:882 start_codon:yes stop_codon:yes gene_type:complete
MNRYQNVYPEKPVISSAEKVRASAADLLTLEFFESEPGEMPEEAFEQHHILINLQENEHRVENWRDGKHLDFTYHKNEVIVTPAGVKSGWRWHAKSKVIVITLEPEKLEKFAKTELGIILTNSQLKDTHKFIDEDITQAATMLMQSLENDISSGVMFESYARIFLIKLLDKYGLEDKYGIQFSKHFTATHYKRVLDYIHNNYGQNIMIEDLAKQAGISTFYFARLFKKIIGETPHQFIMSYRVEKAKQILLSADNQMADVAISCGFSDQAHFSRVFKKIEGKNPKTWRLENSK